MKNKTILFFVLLIPSLCFGRSVKILIITNFEEKTQTIAITDSGTKNRKSYLLKMHSDNIFVEDNKKELVNFLMKLKITIGDMPDFAKGRKSFPYIGTKMEIIETAILNNWQMTFHEGINSDIKVYDSIYIYKQDK